MVIFVGEFLYQKLGSIGVGIFFDLVFIAKKRVSLPWGRRILLGRLSSKMKVSFGSASFSNKPLYAGYARVE
jgi:hypothetical protein